MRLVAGCGKRVELFENGHKTRLPLEKPPHSNPLLLPLLKVKVGEDLDAETVAGTERVNPATHFVLSRDGNIFQRSVLTSYSLAGLY